MDSHLAYQRQQALGWTRIDTLLALLDGGIRRLEQALTALREGESATAEPVLARCRLIVSGLAASVNQDCGEMAVNLSRLYDFVLFSLTVGNVDKVEAALRILQTVREGFQQIRPEALQLEREGTIPPLDALPGLQALA